jgi:hypothetical protein
MKSELTYTTVRLSLTFRTLDATDDDLISRLKLEKCITYNILSHRCKDKVIYHVYNTPTGEVIIIV